MDVKAIVGDATKENLMALAQLAEAAERYEDMTVVLRELVNVKPDLVEGERNLLSVAFKNTVGQRRSSWRSISAEVEKQSSDWAVAYRKQIEQELTDICKSVLEMLESKLIPASDTATDFKATVFYKKMAGDYYRYLAEVNPSEEEYASKATQWYKDALELAESKLSPTHPIRLGLALNFSVCYYEILKSPKQACDLAKQAFDNAIAKLDELDESSYKDSTLIMQLLRDNLTLWTSEGNDDEEAA